MDGGSSVDLIILIVFGACRYDEAKGKTRSGGS